VIALDTSALVKRFVREEHSDWVRERMSFDRQWIGSTLLAAETGIALARLLPDSGELARCDALVSRDLEFFDMVPVDSECLVGAIELGRAFRLRTLDAIHLSAFRLMPPGCSVITFDRTMGSAARDIGLDLLLPPGL
jgi:predicted nucleic acid-binding protein